MIIRKKFKFEGSHVVRNCTSKRCRENIHGHSYIVEILLESDVLDNGDMVMDFGLMKSNIKSLIDAFDHTHVMWDKGAAKEIEFITNNTERWIVLPINPSAEGLSLVFFFFIDHIIKHTIFVNGEHNVNVHSVIVHETETGYAQCFLSDLRTLAFNWQSSDIIFSSELLEEMPFELTAILSGNKITNPKSL